MLQAKIPPTPSDLSLAGKTVIVTGANAGLGFEAARQYLILGASRLILACRTVGKGEEAISVLRADPQVKTSNPTAVIEAFELDLEDYQSGLRFAQRVKREVQELDILLNNAGIVVLSYRKTKSGHESTMQVNCYTYILICLELFPLLRATAAARGSPTRITFVGSATQISQESMSQTTIPTTESIVDYFDSQSKFSRVRRYADSKLVVNAYTRRLAAIAPSEVIVNNLCPGLVQTGLDKNLPVILRGIMGMVRKTMARPVEEGARTLIYASAVASGETNGKFMRDNAVHPGAAFLNTPAGEEFIDRIWEETVEDVISVDPALSAYR